MPSNRKQAVRKHLDCQSSHKQITYFTIVVTTAVGTFAGSNLDTGITVAAQDCVAQVPVVGTMVTDAEGGRAEMY